MKTHVNFYREGCTCVYWNQTETIRSCAGFVFQGFGSKGHRGGFCEMRLEASPMSDGGSARQLHDGSASGQG